MTITEMFYACTNIINEAVVKMYVSVDDFYERSTPIATERYHSMDEETKNLLITRFYVSKDGEVVYVLLKTEVK